MKLPISCLTFLFSTITSQSTSQYSLINDKQQIQFGSEGKCLSLYQSAAKPSSKKLVLKNCFDPNSEGSGTYNSKTDNSGNYIYQQWHIMGLNSAICISIDNDNNHYCVTRRGNRKTRLYLAPFKNNGQAKSQQMTYVDSKGFLKIGGKNKMHVFSNGMYVYINKGVIAESQYSDPVFSEYLDLEGKPTVFHWVGIQNFL